MKTNLRILFLGIAAAVVLAASPVNFVSQGTAVDAGEWNSLGQTMAIIPNLGWAPALPGSSWVSFGATGDELRAGYFIAPDGLVVSFLQTVFLPFQPTTALITYRADDTAAFYINNVLVQPEAPSAGNSYGRCSDWAPGCLTSTEVTLDIASYLQPDVNTLRFDVAQRASYSFGLNYAGYADGHDDPTPRDGTTPEPATFGLIGCAMVGMGLYRRGRS